MANVILLQKGDLKSSDFTNDNSNNKEGIGIRVSSDNGNLLQQRKNGLYYGVEAPPDTANLYVSSSQGDDGNTGTRTAPLKTIREALRRNSVGTKFNIHLFESDVHEWRGSWGSLGTGKVFALQPYGAVFDNVNARKPTGSLYHLMSQEILRPTIKFVYDASWNVENIDVEFNNIVSTTSPVNGRILVRGIQFDQTGEKDLPVRHLHIVCPFGSDSMGIDLDFIGCHFKLGANLAVASIGGFSNVRLSACTYDASTGGKFFYITNNGVLNLSFSNTDIVDGKEIANSPLGQEPLHFRGTPPASAVGPLILGSDATRLANFNLYSQANIFG